MAGRRNSRGKRGSGGGSYAAVQALSESLELWEAMTDPEVIDRAIALFCPRRSERNAKLIVMQRPDATDCEGFDAWKARGRQVLPRPEGVERGAWGIRILSPAGRYADRDEAAADVKAGPAGAADGGEDDGDGKGRGRQRFKIAYVFDISQTKPADEDAAPGGPGVQGAEGEQPGRPPAPERPPAPAPVPEPEFAEAEHGQFSLFGDA